MIMIMIRLMMIWMIMIRMIIIRMMRSMMTMMSLKRRSITGKRSGIISRKFLLNILQPESVFLISCPSKIASRRTIRRF